MVLTDETLERIARLHADGLSVRGIAAELGLSKSSVARALSQLRERAAVRGGPPVVRGQREPAEVSRPAGIPLPLLVARRRRAGTP